MCHAALLKNVAYWLVIVLFTANYRFMNVSQFFAQGQDVQQFAFFFVVFLLCWNIENIYGVTKDYSKWRHSLTNFMFVLPGAVMQALLGLLFVKVLLYENAHDLGLIHAFGKVSTLGEIAIVFVVLDFTYWGYHYIMHKFKAFWPFHAVHHSDTVLNVSTSLREHPVETLIRVGHYTLFTWILGPAFWIITLHQFVQVLTKIIIHSNWRLPDNVDKYLSMLFITPNMHHVHHHYVEPYTDSNYGDLFSIWDRLFGTFRYLPKEEVRFGLDILVEKEADLKFVNLMKLPFEGKRAMSVSSAKVLLGLVLFAAFMSMSFRMPVVGSDNVIVVNVKNVQHRSGTLRVIVYDRSNFLTAKFVTCTSTPAKTGISQLTIKGLPSGDYAVSVYQDLNNNHLIDRNFVGFPTEPFAVSNNLQPYNLVSPSFDKAKIKVQGQKVITVDLLNN